MQYLERKCYEILSRTEQGQFKVYISGAYDQWNFKDRLLFYVSKITTLIKIELIWES